MYVKSYQNSLKKTTVEIYSKKKCQNYNNYGNHNEKILPTVNLKINPVRGLQNHLFNQHFLKGALQFFNKCYV